MLRREELTGRSRTRFGLAAGALAVVALLGCSGARDTGVPGAPREPMILFAVDGLEWDLVRPLVAAGRMPTLENLIRKGQLGLLRSMSPTLSPVIWTTIATGKPPGEHGITHFVYDSIEGGHAERRFFTSGHRRTKAFWNILSDAGLVVDCIGWWMTYPAESINGIMVSQTNTTSVLDDPRRGIWKGTLVAGVSDQVHPPEQETAVLGHLAQMDRMLPALTEKIFGHFPHPFDEFGRMMWEQTQWAFRADATYLRIGRDVLERGEPFDLLAIYVSGSDVAGHRFFQYAHPELFLHRPPADQVENFHDVIDDYYAYIDASIGELLALAPPETTVMVISDHGMHAEGVNRRRSVVDPPRFANSGNHLDAPPGVFILAGPHIAKGATASGSLPERPPLVGDMLDVLPTILALKGVPLGRDMHGEPLLDLVDPAWRAGLEIEMIESHDTPAWIAAQRERVRRAVDEQERIDQLRALGYVE